jgi:hypothetical protein
VCVCFRRRSNEQQESKVRSQKLEFPITTGGIPL